MPYPPDFTEEEIAKIEAVRPYTKSSPERLLAIIHAVDHVIKHDIPGAFVECGVYRGGAAMLMANTDRELWLYDTFAGMPKPSDKDVDISGEPASFRFNKARIDDKSSTWLNASIEEVQKRIPRAHLIKGLVEKTLPDQAPDQIAFLRLDTDFYSSTKHELEHLYPRLSPGGILIIDDYGLFQGARKATDEYFADKPVFLSRIDYTARLICRKDDPT